MKKNINVIDNLNLIDKKIGNELFDIKAIIKGQQRTIKYKKTDGLELLFPDKGASAWSLLSCPTITSQKLYDFTNDAFAILTIGSNIENNLISLYKQNALKPKGFVKKTYNLVTEQFISEELAIKNIEHIEIKEPQNKILIGSSMDLSGVLQDQGKYILRGIKSRFKQENNSGGVKGKNLKLIALDDQYKPFITENNIQKLIDDYKINIFLTTVGSPTLQEILPIIKKNDIGVFFPSSGADLFRAKDLKNINCSTSSI
jgi:ABC-type branched-subunit amino acid transport system substrate-binding protein